MTRALALVVTRALALVVTRALALVVTRALALVATLCFAQGGCGPQRNLSIVPALPTPCSASVNELSVAGLGDFPPLPNTLASAAVPGGVVGPLSLQLPRATQVVTVQGVGAGTTTFGRTAPFSLSTLWIESSHSIAINYGSPDTFCNTTPLAVARTQHRATLLMDGSVLVSGGMDGEDGVTSLERYLPTGDETTPVARFVATGATIDVTSALGHTATLLVDGRVLLSGGVAASSAVPDGIAYSGAQLVDATGNINAAPLFLHGGRAFHAAVRLADGTVLLTGGCGFFSEGQCEVGQTLTSAELFDPTTNTFSDAPALLAPRWGHEALVRDDGLVLVVGGVGADGTALDPELYDPTEAHGASLPGPAGNAVVLGSGLVVGISDAGGPTTRALAWGGSTDTPQLLPQLPSAVVGETLTALEDGTVLVAGGWDSMTPAATSLVLGGDGITSTPLTGFIAYGHTATRLLDGSVLLTGGIDATGAVTSASSIFLRSLVGPYDSPATENFDGATALVPARPGDATLADGALVIDGDMSSTAAPDDYALLAGPIFAGPSGAGFELDALIGVEGSAQAALLFGTPGQSSFVVVMLDVGDVPSVQHVSLSRPGIVNVVAQSGCSGVAVSDAELPQPTASKLAALTLVARQGKVQLRSATRTLLRCGDEGWPTRGALALGARAGRVHYDNVSVTR